MTQLPLSEFIPFASNKFMFGSQLEFDSYCEQSSPDFKREYLFTMLAVLFCTANTLFLIITTIYKKFYLKESTKHFGRTLLVPMRHDVSGGGYSRYTGDANKDRKGTIYQYRNGKRH